MNSTQQRCAWANTNELFIPYHDIEWGTPVHDDRLLFEMLNLESAQAGLSWLTILRRRDNYRAAFDNFDAEKIAAYDESKRAELLNDVGIIRNKLKIDAVIANSIVCLDIQKQYGSFDTYIWKFTGNNNFSYKDRDTVLALSATMSKALKKAVFRFVGPTTCFAFMQAVGLINDHEPYCFRS